MKSEKDIGAAVNHTYIVSMQHLTSFFNVSCKPVSLPGLISATKSTSSDLLLLFKHFDLSFHLSL